MNSAYSFFAGWFLIIAGAFGLSRFEPTRVFLYYILWLTVILMIVTHANDITSLLATATHTDQTLMPVTAQPGSGDQLIPGSTTSTPATLPITTGGSHPTF